LNHKHFYPIISDNYLSERAIHFVKNRRIPESIWKDWFVCTDGKYRNRLIIPFYHKDKIYYYQGRSLYDHQEPKYLSRDNGKGKCVYNIYNVDRNAPIMATEGPIDSMFLDNAIAIIGTNMSENVEAALMKMGVYLILDNDVAGFTKSEEFLRKGFNIFLWKKYLKDHKIDSKVKDINDLYIELDRKDKFVFDEFKKYFSNSIYDKVFLK
jgi:hypothetical protein